MSEWLIAIGSLYTVGTLIFGSIACLRVWDDTAELKRTGTYVYRDKPSPAEAKRLKAQLRESLQFLKMVPLWPVHLLGMAREKVAEIAEAVIECPPHRWETVGPYTSRCSRCGEQVRDPDAPDGLKALAAFDVYSGPQAMHAFLDVAEERLAKMRAMREAQPEHNHTWQLLDPLTADLPVSYGCTKCDAQKIVPPGQMEAPF